VGRALTAAHAQRTLRAEGSAVVPTMIAFGLVFGRWWKSALVVGSLGWPAALLASSTITAEQLPAALGLGLANTTVGVAVHQAVLRAVRALRSTPPPA
jgi:hypothetical protein